MPTTSTNDLIQLGHDPIDLAALVRHVRTDSDGAIVTFDGCVRDNSHGRRTLYLEYESYEAMALAKEQVNAIWKAVAHLSVKQRTVFLLRFVEDMDLLEIAGITAGNASRGHRVLHGSAPVAIGKAGEYKEALRKAFVVVDVAERRQIIRKALDAATRTISGARWREDQALVETVTHLTEWPSVILGEFEAEYLELPEEVLVFPSPVERNRRYGLLMSLRHAGPRRLS